MIGDSIPISHQIKYISASNNASNPIIQKIESHAEVNAFESKRMIKVVCYDLPHH